MEFAGIRYEKAFILVFLIQALDLQGVDSARQCNILDKYQRKPALLNDFHLQQYTRDGLVSYYFNYDFISIYKIIFNITMERWSVIRRDVSFSINGIIPEHNKWTKGVGCPKGFKGDRNNSKVCWPVFDPCPHLNCSDCVITINFGKNASEIAKHVMNVGIKSVIYHNASNDCPTAPEKYDGMPEELYNTKWRIPQYSNKILGKKPCRDGFNLINFNEPRLHCSEGVWKGTKPKCEPILTATTSNIPPAPHQPRLISYENTSTSSALETSSFRSPTSTPRGDAVANITTSNSGDESMRLLEQPYFYPAIVATFFVVCLFILVVTTISMRRKTKQPSKIQQPVFEEPTYANIGNYSHHGVEIRDSKPIYANNTRTEQGQFYADISSVSQLHTRIKEDEIIYCDLEFMNETRSKGPMNKPVVKAKPAAAEETIYATVLINNL